MALFADNPVIAPTEDYRKKDESQLHREQDQRQTEENKEATSPGSDMSKTEVSNQPSSTSTTTTTTSAVTLDGLDGEDLPATRQQFASGKGTPSLKGLSRRPESTKKESLYDCTASLVRLLASERGGIGESTGDAELNLDGLKGVMPSKPNSQVLPYNGSAKEVDADRLGTECDPLTKDFENYGTSGRHGAYAERMPLLMDPSTVSSYSRDNSLNRNTTEHEIDAESTVDEPEPAGSLVMRGQEGEETFAYMRMLAAVIPTMKSTRTPRAMANPPTNKPTKGYKRPPGHSKPKLGIESKFTYDGDFDPAGRTTGDHMITENPDNHGYLNLHSSVEEDGDVELEALCEVEADADPSLFNVATQPLGQAG
jgi:hypothetical protein